ncbi:MAG TPA: hypothetical protein DEB30_01885 [Candidatus Peribacter riflensis]|uniref:Peptidase M23B n=1 Tax=Candidatus Peribacter riflensis TaxID=1735162 RepID=A0A0S1SAQ8_9BACT|nr:MAG: peptidase M23B [Candidatus Peribacter riflensis]OGJ78288.1 MAG: hypothetical protein A2398_05375 [Candidatus Peribacteria bacterium RIFOXYB1_FULL_57_12]OGJ81945.1 MAG: hypothetical protein A2412_00395 [Candidatus Peribacteria bacterium RIFOXYC1_FULL_58_8]ALM10816.1 MAG: peptidase M23B [Candidatus Peribacter riflensis]ALM11918.1 MAG: peptidase M23B [Candidatus Peribacter riflensis]
MAAESLSIVPALRLPFNAAYPVQITQGFHGPFHRLIGPQQLDYALDFGLSYGSIVRAARRGIVALLSMDSNVYSSDPQPDVARIQLLSRFTANFILLDHGEFQTLYAHLQKGSQRVEQGQAVEAGQVLARTGRSGWVGDIPNLHFQAQRWTKQDVATGHRGRTATLPVRFADYDRPLEHDQIVGCVQRAQS